jgi:septin family protein
MVGSIVLVWVNALLRDPTVIEENGVRLRLNIVDTPGYGDQVNNDRWYDEKSTLLEV